MKTPHYIYLLAGALCFSAAPAAFGQAKTAPPRPGTHAAAVTTRPDVLTATSQMPAHATFAMAIDTSGLAEEIQGRGPYTVFAPSDAAFQALPAGLFSFMLKEEDKGTLKKMMATHVVKAKLDAAKILKDIKYGKGKASYRTLSGAHITLSKDDTGRVIITDDKGEIAHIGAHDIKQSNGLIHVIDKVLIPQQFN